MKCSLVLVKLARIALFEPSRHCSNFLILRSTYNRLIAHDRSCTYSVTCVVEHSQ
jgi:hypothetical protein